MAAGEHRWAAGLSSDHEIAERFTDETLFASFSRFEQALINGLARAGLVAAADAADLARQIAALLATKASIPPGKGSAPLSTSSSITASSAAWLGGVGITRRR